MSSDSSPRWGPKPRSALPSHLVNGNSPLHPNPGSSSRARERDNLNSSIRASFRGAVDLDPATPAVVQNKEVSTQDAAQTSEETQLTGYDFFHLSTACKLISSKTGTDPTAT
jgi:hypothetical protein